MHSRIRSTGAYLPQKICTNDDLAQVVNTSDTWIRERTGICQRHIASEEDTISFMSYHAALDALESSELSAKDIDMVLVATASAEQAFPSVACQVQSLLKLKQGPAFDINAACSGFIYALSIAEQFIKTAAAKHILVIGADALSKLCDPSDRGTVILFGDGAGAVILSASETPGLLSTELGADGNFGTLLECNMPKRPHELCIDSYLRMRGNEVFKIAVSQLSDLVTSTLTKHQLTQDDIDWLVPHQANLRIIKATAKKLNMSLDKVVVTVDQHGNTSAASVPLALNLAIKEGRIQRGHTILMEAFGSGFTWGSALMIY
jgi:3-oxoacyl-[acyl-carrier-protein] synthase-3